MILRVLDVFHDTLGCAHILGKVCKVVIAPRTINFLLVFKQAGSIVPIQLSVTRLGHRIQRCQSLGCWALLIKLPVLAFIQEVHRTDVQVQFPLVNRVEKRLSSARLQVSTVRARQVVIQVDGGNV